jgi:hypothetical protein
MCREPSFRPFIITTEGRAGSSFLTSLLNSHSDVLCFPEILIDLKRSEQEYLLDDIAARRIPSRLSTNASNPLYYPVSFEEKLRSAPFAAVGLKTKIIDLRNAPASLQALHSLGYQLIHLYRRNPVKAVVSLFRGEQLNEKIGEWNSQDPADRHNKVSIAIERVRFALERRALEQSLGEWFFSHFRGKKMIISYEDLTEMAGPSLHSLFEFLYIEPESLESRLVKISPPKLSDAVTNYDALYAALLGTQYEEFLD